MAGMTGRTRRAKGEQMRRKDIPATLIDRLSSAGLEVDKSVTVTLAWMHEEWEKNQLLPWLMGTHNQGGQIKEKVGSKVKRIKK